ncbi:MAG TPA: membrane dipeptidase [Caulobacteraceae bacterium]|jgi:membrane dipeptidase|nr:membrane dipeptidase [Caulobacteraceae bacterium]
MRRRSFLAASTALLATAGVAHGAARSTSGGLPALTVNGSDASMPSAEFFELNRKGGVGCVMINGWGGESLSDYAEMQTRFFSDGSRRLVRRYEDVLDAQAKGQLAVVLGNQSADTFASAAPGNDWGFMSAKPSIHLEEHYKGGLRILNFCYNLSNQFGGGCLEPDIPLTASGRYLQDAMESMGILVDTAGHTGRRTALDVTKRAKKPLICSHANVMALNPNPRCLTDDVIRAIADTGGVVGITASEDLMQRNAKTAGKALPRCTLSRFADEFDYVRRLVGADHVGVGPDFVYGKSMPDGLGRSMVFPPDMVIPQNPLRYAVGFEDPSQFQNLPAELRRRGWPQGDIAKVMGQNWLRVYRAVFV